MWRPLSFAKMLVGRPVRAIASWWPRLMLVGIALWSAAAPAQTRDQQTRHLSVSLAADSAQPAAGSDITLAVVMRPQSGWHGYWHTPGDAGFAPKFAWALPAGLSAGAESYPLPGLLLIDGMMNHVYDHEYAVLVPLHVAPGLAAGSRLPVNLKLSYLVCSRQVCVPESADVSTTLSVGDGTKDGSMAAQFAAWRSALPQPLNQPARFAFANGKLRIAMPLAELDAVSKPHLFVDGADIVNFSAPQTFSHSGNTLIVETAAAGTASHGFDAVIGLNGTQGLSFHALPGTVPSEGQPLTASSTQAGKAGGGNVILLTLVAFGGAVLGGLILNVMPCVFPILSLKALNLARGGQDDTAAKVEAVSYAAGTIVVCVALGGLILILRGAGNQVGWAFQLQSPSVIFALILLVGAIAFNLAGLFELTNLSAGSGLMAKEGWSGAFWTGALAAFIATPCTGPFMAAALGAALVLPTLAALLIFLGLGVGLSLPFLAIGFIPSIRRALPKPGMWMVTFRHALALPMFATALGLAWVLGNQSGTSGIILALAALLLVSLGLWGTGLRQRAGKSYAWLPGLVMLLVAVPLLAILPKAPANALGSGSAAGPSSATVPFDSTKLAALRSRGTPVFLYLTADWCLTCKVNERIAIDRDVTQAAFAKAGVVTMVGDWTGGNADITQFLEKNGRSGVPMYIWYKPNESGDVLPQVLSTTILIDLARGSNT